MEWWQAAMILLAILVLGIFISILLYYLNLRFILKRDASLLNTLTLLFAPKKLRIHRVVEEQQTLMAPGLLAEIEHNHNIASQPLGEKLLPLETRGWEAQQREVDKLPANLRDELQQVYVDIRLVNNLVWLSTELERRSPDSDKTYMMLCNIIAERLDRVKGTGQAVQDGVKVEAKEAKDRGQRKTEEAKKRAKRESRESKEKSKMETREIKEKAKREVHIIKERAGKGTGNITKESVKKEAEAVWEQAEREAESVKGRARMEAKEAWERARREVEETKEIAQREAAESKEKGKQEAKEAMETAEKEAEEAREIARREAEEAKERITREIEEPEGKAGRQAQEAKKAKEAVVKKQAEQAIIDKRTKEAQEARERGKQSAEEAWDKAQREVEDSKKRVEEEVQEAKERAQSELEEVTTQTVTVGAGELAGSRLYDGMVELVIASPARYHQITELQEYLHKIQDLRLVLVGGTVKKGTKIIVSAGKPMPLLEILSRIPNVEQVISKGKTIQIALRAE